MVHFNASDLLNGYLPLYFLILKLNTDSGAALLSHCGSFGVDKLLCVCICGI